MNQASDHENTLVSFLCSTVFPSPFHKEQLEQFVRDQDDQLVLEPGTVPSRVVVVVIRVSILP